MADCCQIIVFLAIMLCLCGVAIYLEGPDNELIQGNEDSMWSKFPKPTGKSPERWSKGDDMEEMEEEIDEYFFDLGQYEYFSEFHDVLRIFKEVEAQKHVVLVVDTSEANEEICQQMIDSAVFFLRHFNIRKKNLSTEHVFSLIDWNVDSVTQPDDFESTLSLLESMSCGNFVAVDSSNLNKKIYENLLVMQPADFMYLAVFSSKDRKKGTLESNYAKLIENRLKKLSEVESLGIRMILLHSPEEQEVDDSQVVVSSSRKVHLIEDSETVVKAMNESLNIWNVTMDETDDFIYVKTTVTPTLPSTIFDGISAVVTFRILSDVNKYRGTSIYFDITQGTPKKSIFSEDELEEVGSRRNVAPFLKKLSSQAKRKAKDLFVSEIKIKTRNDNRALMKYEYPTAMKIHLKDKRIRAFGTDLDRWVRVSDYKGQFEHFSNSRVLVMGEQALDVVESMILSFTDTKNTKTEKMSKVLQSFVEANEKETQDEKIVQSFEFPLHDRTEFESGEEILSNQVVVLKSVPSTEEYDAKLFLSMLRNGEIGMENYSMDEYKALVDSINSGVYNEEKGEKKQEVEDFETIVFTLPHDFLDRKDQRDLLKPIVEIKEYFKNVPTVFVFVKSWEEHVKSMRNKTGRHRTSSTAVHMNSQHQLYYLYRLENVIPFDSTFLENVPDTLPYLLESYFVNSQFTKFEMWDEGVLDLEDIMEQFLVNRNSIMDRSSFQLLHVIEENIISYRNQMIERFCEEYESLCFFQWRKVRDVMDDELKQKHEEGLSKPYSFSIASLLFQRWFVGNNGIVYDSEILYQLDRDELSIYEWMENLKYYDSHNIPPFDSLYSSLKEKIIWCSSNLMECKQELNDSVTTKIQEQFKEENGDEIDEEKEDFNVGMMEFCSEDIDTCYCLLDKYKPKKGKTTDFYSVMEMTISMHNRKKNMTKEKNVTSEEEVVDESNGTVKNGTDDIDNNMDVQEEEKKEEDEKVEKEEEEESIDEEAESEESSSDSNEVETSKNEEEELMKLFKLFEEDEKKQVFRTGREYDEYYRRMRNEHGKNYEIYANRGQITDSDSTSSVESVDGKLRILKSEKEEFEESKFACFLGEDKSLKSFYEPMEEGVEKTWFGFFIVSGIVLAITVVRYILLSLASEVFN